MAGMFFVAELLSDVYHTSTMKKLFVSAVFIAVLALVVFTLVSNRPTEPVLTQLKPTEIVELQNGDTFDLTASMVRKEINGQAHEMLAYNGSIPGPVLRVAQGSEITVNFKNETNMETTIHSHGVRLDNAYDGVPHVTQEAVQPGETFEYKLWFPDAGMYWYHPHVREDYQQELGMYGNYWVLPSDAGYWSEVNREIPLFVDDILIERGQIRLSEARADHTLMGRYGNVFLINGETDYTLDVSKGEVIRFFFTNAANTRPFKLAIPGARLKIVGADGGAYEQEFFADSVVLAPSERAIVHVLFDQQGTFALQNITPEKTYTLGEIRVSTTPVARAYDKEFGYSKTNFDTVTSIDAHRPFFSSAPDKQLTLTIDMGAGMMGGHAGHMMGMGTSADGIEWNDTNGMMNAMSNTDTLTWIVRDQQTGKENMDIDWKFTRGQSVKIRLFNDPDSMHPMQHPIHFHGQRFLVVAREGITQTNLVWKDTVLIAAGETVDIILDTTNPGTWMAHCHIAEHLEAGMMFGFTIR